MHALGLANYSSCFLGFPRKLTYSKHTEKNKRGEKTGRGKEKGTWIQRKEEAID